MPKGPEKFRDIADAREGNKLLADWGVRMHTRQDLADALTSRASVWGHDLKDGYHLAVLSGCTGELVWGWGGDHEVAEDGRLAGNRERQIRLELGWHLHVGCLPGTAASPATSPATAQSSTAAAVISARILRAPRSTGLFCACCYTGRCVLRRPARGGERRWVDDFAFHRWVKPLPPCGALGGGCAERRVGLGEAAKLDAFWMELCESLGDAPQSA